MLKFIHHAQSHSRHFTFEAFAASEPEARGALVRVLMAHARQYRMEPDDASVWIKDMMDGAEVTEFELSKGYRDRQPVPTRDYRSEFPSFDPATLPAIPASWSDESWHNDACPSFYAGQGLIVYVDHADEAARDSQGGKRFCVMHGGETEFTSDDWSAVLAYVAAHLAQHQ